MYTPGKIIYFNPFYFKNGSEAKPKYLLVLKNLDNTSIIASHPSSKCHLPWPDNCKHGCLESQEGCYGCYMIERNRPITPSGWSFCRDTFLYGNWIEEYQIEMLKDVYRKPSDYKVIGELNQKELKKVVCCFSNSANVKKRFQRLLLT